MHDACASLSARLLGIGKHSLEGINTLNKTSQMYFEDLTMVIMQILILYKVLDCPALVEDPTVVHMTLIKAIVNILFQYTKWWLESSACNESVILLSLENMTARVSWLPFIKRIKNADGQFDIDIGNIRASYPIASKMLGVYRNVQFQFTLKSL